MRILVAEDERDMNKIIAKKLISEGYAVDTAFDGEEALSFIEYTEYDAIVLDVMMPKVDGFTVVSKMRDNKISIPVLFLTAKDSISDRVKGLDIGGNDYLVKPFSFEELMARIRVLTRKKAGEITNVLEVGNLTMDTSSHIVKKGDEEITLSSKEYAVLEYMMLNKGVVLSRDKIESHIWSYDYEGSSNVVDVYIRYLRKKIGAELIHTVRGAGYVIRVKK